MDELIANELTVEDDIYRPPFFPEKEKTIFFDIETTGLSSRNAGVYLIGYAVYENEKWQLRQLFAERMSDEQKILKAACDLLSSYDAVVTFNGDNFDIPFINKSLKDYGLEPPTIKRSVDLFKILRPFKDFLGLENAKQTTFEGLLGFDRNDDKNGGELIPVYKEYLKDHDERKKEDLLRHNMYDVRRMLRLPEILKISDVMKNILHIDNVSAQADRLSIEYTSACRLAFKLSHSSKDIMLEAEEDRVHITVPVSDGKTRFYYNDPENYYYLPMEDRAIHKSLAGFVDSSHRQRATKANCYSNEPVSVIVNEKNLTRFIDSLAERFLIKVKAR